MITAIEIENFKAFGSRQRIELKPITLLFGPNSAGKSTVLHAIQYAADVLQRGNLDADRTATSGDSFDLGGFASFVHGRRLERMIRIAFELTFDAECKLGEIAMPVGNDNEAPIGALRIGSVITNRPKSCRVELAMRWSVPLGRPVVGEYRVDFDGIPMAAIECWPERKSVDVTSINLDHPLFGWHWPGSKMGPFPDWPDFRIGAGPVEISENDTFEEDLTDHISEMKQLAAEFGSTFWYWYRCAHSPPAGFDKRFIRIPVLGTNDALPEPSQALKLVTPSMYGDPDAPEPDQLERLGLTAILTQALVAPLDLLRRQLRGLTYVGPIRQKPDRDHRAPRMFDPSRWASGLAGWDWLLTTDNENLSEASEWLSRKDRLDTGYGLIRHKTYQLDSANLMVLQLLTGGALDSEDLAERVKALPVVVHLRLLDLRTGLHLDARDVGEGIAQVVPVVAATLSARNCMLMIEQPELHVHQRVQVGIGDLLIRRISTSGKFPTIVETHSVPLLLRLMRRIRESSKQKVPEKIQGSDVMICFFAPKEESVEVIHIGLADDGELLRPWPDNQFEIDFDERFSA